MFKLTGTVKLINETKQISEKFSLREFVISETSSMYPQDILFQATQDKCSLLDSVKVQDQIEVSFNLKGREWTSPTGEVKHFNTMEAWRIEKAEQGGYTIPKDGPSPMSLGSEAAATMSATNNASSESTEESDDLPF